MVAAAIFALTVGAKEPSPVLWLNPKGTLLVGGKETSARLTSGASAVQTPYGLGLDVNGKTGGLLIADLPELALTDSMTVTAWVFVREVPANRAPLFFRGDDRNGNDPIELSLQYHKVTFGVGKLDDVGTYAQAEFPTKEWFRVTASYDSEMKELRIWINGALKDSRHTDLRPFAELDANQHPGVSLGNVQNDKGPHNQPMDGIVADLKLYRGVFEPKEVGYRGGGS